MKFSCLLLLLGLSAIHAQSCGLSDSEKKDCGYMGIDQNGCVGKGCCWVSSSVQGTPWCFYSSGGNVTAPTPAPVITPTAPAPTVPSKCGISDSTKKDCGYSGINQNGCETKGCCWASTSTPNTPWCFYSTDYVSPTQFPAAAPTGPAPSGCSVFSENHCNGNTIVTDPSFEDHKWFTPAPGSTDYQTSFQSYHVLAAHVHLVYDYARTSVTATIVAEHRDKAALSYVFGAGAAAQASPVRQFAASAGDVGPIAVSVLGADGSRINLDEIDLLWAAPAVHPLGEAAGDYRSGQKGAVVEAFMWPHAEVAKECAMLAKMGYMGVKLFPTQEQIMSFEPFSNDLNPWYFAYQPVSYRLQGRMGSRADLRAAIRTCRAAGVRVYADAVINHMTGGGNDANPHHVNPGAACATWGAKNSSLNLNAAGSAVDKGPSPMYTQSYVYTVGAYTGKPPSQEFPAAHLGPTDFHCERSLNAWTDPLQLNAGWLSGLTDLNTEKDNVQERIADYLTDLLSIGFSGFRIDAAKHINPDDLVAILSKLKRNLGGQMPPDWVTYLEVLLGGEADLLMCNVNSGYNYGGYLESALKGAGWSAADVEKVKIWNSGYPKEPGLGYCSISPTRNAIQNDDADQQNPGSSSRDMGSEGCVLVKGCPVADHRNFEVKLFQNPNGAKSNDNDYPIRLVLSSFFWNGNSAAVPDGLSDCSLCTINCGTCHGTAYAPAFSASSCGYEKSSYTRAHRDLAVVNAMRAWMHLNATSAAALGLAC